MEAMILAAGLGTRLRPLTDRAPKALLEVAGMPLIERVGLRLVSAGVDRLVVNLHPFADRVRRFVRERGGFGVEVLFSEEQDGPLGTGGGLAHARHLFRADAPFFLHNVDVLSDLPLEALYAAHVERQPSATVAVMDRPSSRGLLFDDRGLCGRVDDALGVDLRVRPTEGEVVRLAFAGIHVVSPGLLKRVPAGSTRSILDPYLETAAAGERILPFRADGCAWLDVGTPERLAEAQRRYAL